MDTSAQSSAVRRNVRGKGNIRTPDAARTLRLRRARHGCVPQHVVCSPCGPAGRRTSPGTAFANRRRRVPPRGTYAARRTRARSTGSCSLPRSGTARTFRRCGRFVLVASPTPRRPKASADRQGARCGGQRSGSQTRSSPVCRWRVWTSLFAPVAEMKGRERVDVGQKSGRWIPGSTPNAAARSRPGFARCGSFQTGSGASAVGVSFRTHKQTSGEGTWQTNFRP